MGPQDPERIVTRRLRQVTAALLGLGLVVVAISYAPVPVETAAGAQLEPTGWGSLIAFYLGVLFLPGAGVAAWPRRGGIAIWALWSVPVSMLAMLVKADLGEMPYGRVGSAPEWPGIVIACLLIAIHVGILLVLPVIRGTHRPPPRRRDPPVPVARIHMR